MSEYNISKIYENDKRSFKSIDDLLAKEEIRRDKNLIIPVLCLMMI